MSRYDAIFLANGTVETSHGTVGSYQTIIMPSGCGTVFAVRTKNGRGRWGSWEIATSFSSPSDDLANVIGLNVIDLTTSTASYALGSIAHLVPSDQVIAPDYRGIAAPATGNYRYNRRRFTPTSAGFVLASHEELAEVKATSQIPKTLSARISKCANIAPGAKFAGMPYDGTSEFSDWQNAKATGWTISRWDNRAFPTRPNGTYSYDPYDGGIITDSPGAPAGEPIVIEKRTFENRYSRPNGDYYYGRKIDAYEDVEVLRKCRENGVNVLAYGPPGTGKTAMYEAAFGDELITVLGTAETEVADFIGSYTQRPGEGYVWVDGPLVKAMEQGKALLIDEIGLVDPKVLSIVYSVMDGRGELTVTQNPDRGTIHAAEGFYIVAATNPDAPGVILSEALLSRFTVQVEVDSDYELARHLSVPKKVVRAAETLDKKRRAGEILWAPQMREMFAYKTNNDLFGETFALRTLIAACPEIDRETVCDVLSKAHGVTLSPLRMEG